MKGGINEIYLPKIVNFNPILKKIYPDCIGNNPILDLEMDKMEYGRNAFIICLKYAIDHNQHIVNKLDKPELYLQDKYLPSLVILV